MIELSDGNVNLVIGPDRQAAFQATLDGLVAREGVACVLLIDTAGKIIAGAGGLGRLEAATVAALAAGDFATTRALARRVGEKEFSLVFQREREFNAYLQAVGDEALLVVLFDQVQGLGNMRVLVRQAQADLRKTLDQCPRTVVGPEALRAVVEEKPLAGVESAPSAATATPASAAALGQQEAAAMPAAPGLVKNPPADLIRRFWRIKTLAEDCVKTGVPGIAPAEWASAREGVAGVASAVSSGDAPAARSLLAGIETTLMKAYGRVVADRAARDEEAAALRLWHGLVTRSTEAFSHSLGVITDAVLANVDRDSMDRHPDVLGRAEGGRLPDGALRPIAAWPRDRRRQAVSRAFLDLLLNRLWVADKVLGRAEGDALVGRWREAVAGRGEDQWPAGLKTAIGYLFASAEKRAATRRSPPPSRSPAPGEGGGT